MVKTDHATRTIPTATSRAAHVTCTIPGRGARTLAPSATVAGAQCLTGLLACAVDGDGGPDLVAQSAAPTSLRRTVFLL